MSMKVELEEKGFFTVKNFFKNEEIDNFRNLCNQYFQNNKYYRGHGGCIVPGWSGITPELKEMNFLHEDQRILDVVESVMGSDYIFAQHSDLHQNKASAWHTDTKDYERGGGIWPNWDDDYFIIKVSVLLQDHIDNDFGLWVRPKTHKNIMTEFPMPIHSSRNDLIVFDQKIMHRGMKDSVTYKNLYKQDRYLITYGYGLDNEKTHTHMKGCVKRQNQQRDKMT